MAVVLFYNAETGYNPISRNIEGATSIPVGCSLFANNVDNPLGGRAAMTGCKAAITMTSWWAVRATTGYMGTRGDDLLLGRAGNDKHYCAGGRDFANGGPGQDIKVGCEKFQDSL